MTEAIDRLLQRLRDTRLDYNLDRLEADVWTRLDSRNTDIFGVRGWQIQVLVTCGALLVGVFVAQWTGMSFMPEPLNSEIIVLSDDSAVAPSVILEGGI